MKVFLTIILLAIFTTELLKMKSEEYSCKI